MISFFILRHHQQNLVRLVGAGCLGLLLVAASAQQAAADPPNPAAVASAPENKDWMAHFQRNLDRTRRGNVDLLFDGDSITDGWQGAGKEVWTKNFGRLNAVDYGISGDRTEGLLWRLDHGQAAFLHPRLVAILIGTNNTDRCTDAQIAEGVTAVVREYQKLCPSAMILLQAIFPRAENPADPTREKITRVNQILAQLGDGKKVVYVDFGDRFLLSDGTLNRDLLPDTLHPNAKGYAVWAEAIRPTLQKVFGSMVAPR